jgi:hypothetical protein
MDNAIDESPETVTNISQMEKSTTTISDRWAQQWSIQYICSKDTGPGILIKKLIFKYRSHEERDGNGKDSTKIDMELNKW